MDNLHVTLDNGVFQLTLSKPGGLVTGIAYNGIDNLMEPLNPEFDRGYWDLVWNRPSIVEQIYDRIEATNFTVIEQRDDRIEVSFTRLWRPPASSGTKGVPLNIDIRFILLAGKSGFYTYAIYEHPKGWPDFDLPQTRAVFKLRKDRFQYMAMADDRQRIMPMPEDLEPPRGYPLAYKEAVRLVNATNPAMTGEVDCKYQYSTDDERNLVHGWISFRPPTGFWTISPSDEYRIGGPFKQSLTSHVGPTTLAMFMSDHYAGTPIVASFRKGEYWKKVFGPVFIYLNRVGDKGNPLILWEDAKSQMTAETRSWPYEFPASKDFLKARQRGSVVGRLLVRDRYINKGDMPASSARVGLAFPGEAGSWQTESKGYQFWVKANVDGSFKISNIRPGVYNLFASVSGFIGDFKHPKDIAIVEGSLIDLGALLYEPPRDGPTLWEIGVPDRSAAEFFIPDPNPDYVNKLYLNGQNRFRQYGLWERYAELYPTKDLVYRVGVSNYARDWFYAQVTRRLANTSGAYGGTTWEVQFKLNSPIRRGLYKLRIALAAAKRSRLMIWINDKTKAEPHFSTDVIGEENSIARLGIHGLYRLFSVDVGSGLLVDGMNVIFLNQPVATSAFVGIMYDYIRLEEPHVPSVVNGSPRPSLTGIYLPLILPLGIYYGVVASQTRVPLQSVY